MHRVIDPLLIHEQCDLCTVNVFDPTMYVWYWNPIRMIHRVDWREANFVSKIRVQHSTNVVTLLNRIPCLLLFGQTVVIGRGTTKYLSVQYLTSWHTIMGLDRGISIMSFYVTHATVIYLGVIKRHCTTVPPNDPSICSMLSTTPNVNFAIFKRRRDNNNKTAGRNTSLQLLLTIIYLPLPLRSLPIWSWNKFWKWW